MKASKDFTWEELECKCGCRVRCIDEASIQRLQELRDRVGRPLHISSAARCPDHNAAVGGAKNSRHLSVFESNCGCVRNSDAFDILLRGHSGKELAADARAVGFRGIGIADTFVHVDTRDKSAEWTY